MKILSYGLALLLFCYTATITVVAGVPRHDVVFLNDPCLKPLSEYDYLTCDPIYVIIDGDYYVIPENFQTDLASIPRILWPFIAPQYSSFIAPSILHDYLYSCANLGTRKFADEVLYNALKAEGVSTFTAIKFFMAVRIFGASHFDSRNNNCEKFDG